MGKNSKTITPNQWQQAIQELANFNLQGFKIPSKIQEGEKDEYVCICIKSRDTMDGTAKVHSARISYAPHDKWREMLIEQKSGRVKGLFNGMYNKVVVLHNPTLPLAAEEKPKVKGLSPTHKSKVKELAAAGVGALEIASELEIKVERVEAYLNK